MPGGGTKVDNISKIAMHQFAGRLDHKPQNKSRFNSPLLEARAQMRNFYKLHECGYCLYGWVAAGALPQQKVRGRFWGAEVRPAATLRELRGVTWDRSSSILSYIYIYIIIEQHTAAAAAVAAAASRLAQSAAPRPGQPGAPPTRLVGAPLLLPLLLPLYVVL
jgi:hypothetical protein